MGFSRKDFLFGIGGLTAASAFRAYGEAAAFPPIRIGAVSDIHFREKGGEAVDFRYGSHGAFRAALEYFRDRKADAVTVTGDMADAGKVAQLEIVGRIWREVFPGDRRPDGGHVEPLFIYGNHDLFKAGDIGPDKAGAWKRAFGRDNWAPIYSAKVNGYAFICVSWGYEKQLPDYVRAHERELGLREPRPFFVLQHPIPKGTVFAHSGTWGEDKGAVTACLSQYPNAVSLSGHTHMACSDDREIWQGAFTAINCCTLAQIKTPSRCENCEKWKETRPQHMKAASRKGKQGYFMTVYPDRLEVESRDFVFGLESADKRTVPIPVNGTTPDYAYVEQAKRCVPPAWPEGASVTVLERDGIDSNKTKERQVVVRFPSATAAGHRGRVERYLVEALDGERTVLVREVAQESYFHPIAKIPATQDCVFGKAELPSGAAIRWRVTPVGVFGQKGRPLVGKAD